MEVSLKYISAVKLSKSKMFRFCSVALLLGSFLIHSWSCSKIDEKQSAKPTFEKTPTIAALPVSIKSPTDNPQTPEKVRLGKLLFYDPILSGDKDVACASCHHPEFAYAEPIDLSIGVGGKGLGGKRRQDLESGIPLVKRNAQSILNTAFNGFLFDAKGNSAEAPMFWDLRAESLEEQALEPIKAFEEMRGKHFSENEIIDVVVKRLERIKGYQDLFAEAFPEDGSVNARNLSYAIAAFERSLVANNSRFDQYMRGDKKALSFNEIEGMKRFGEAGCISCHNGPMFSDFKVHSLGVVDHEGLDFIDMGKDSTYAFRTPTLRNLRFSFPYMHNGKLTTIRRVLEFYEDLSGGKVKNQSMNPELIDPLIKNLKVDFRDLSLIEEFINSLNDESYDKRIPETVPSGLAVGGNI